MSGRILLLAIVGLMQLEVIQGAFAQDELPSPLQSPQQKAGYGIGITIGNDFRRGGLDLTTIDLQAFVLGLQDAIAGKEPRLQQAEVQEAMNQIQQIARNKLEQKMQQVAEENKVKGPQFMAKFKALDGVKSLPGGLLYKVIKSGNGASPTETDRVTTHYRGRLIDGTEFDSSIKRGQPATFPVNGVIKGWTEALKQMKVGDKWQLAIPPEMAYGAQGSPPVIGPNAVLVFDIELLGIEQPGNALP